MQILQQALQALQGQQGQQTTKPLELYEGAQAPQGQQNSSPKVELSDLDVRAAVLCVSESSASLADLAQDGLHAGFSERLPRLSGANP